MKLTRDNTSKFVQAGAVKVHYHEAGTGPVLLCIHGGAPGAFGWGNFGRNLRRCRATSGRSSSICRVTGAPANLESKGRARASMRVPSATCWMHWISAARM